MRSAGWCRYSSEITGLETPEGPRVRPAMLYTEKPLVWVLAPLYVSTLAAAHAALATRRVHAPSAELRNFSGQLARVVKTRRVCGPGLQCTYIIVRCANVRHSTAQHATADFMDELPLGKTSDRREVRTARSNAQATEESQHKRGPHTLQWTDERSTQCTAFRVPRPRVHECGHAPSALYFLRPRSRMATDEWENMPPLP